jgi:ribosomal protein S18 acetylase RimI-like enzyme
VRGLRLFVRPIEAADGPPVQAFLARQATSLAAAGLSLRDRNGGPEHAAPLLPAWGLLGKLLGDIVAVVVLELTDDALRINEIVVAHELRRKWIGRAMLREVDQLAAKMDRRRVIVEDARGTQEFWRRVGFQIEGERWVRLVP